MIPAHRSRWALAWIVTCHVGLGACRRRVDVRPKSVQVSGYRALADGSYHAGLDGPRDGFYVRGHLDGQAFVAGAEVEGDGEVGENGVSGWMELADGSFHATLPTAPPPERPYVVGFLNLDGSFSPSERRVMR